MVIFLYNYTFFFVIFLYNQYNFVIFLYNQYNFVWIHGFIFLYNLYILFVIFLYNQYNFVIFLYNQYNFVIFLYNRYILFGYMIIFLYNLYVSVCHFYTQECGVLWYHVVCPCVLHLSVMRPSVFLFPDDNLSKCQWIFTNLGVFIDILWRSCLGLLMGKFGQFLTVVCLHYV